MRTDWQEYQIKIRSRAKQGLKRLRKRLGKSKFQSLRQAIDNLKHDPESQTQELYGALAEFRSLHFGRVRIVIKLSNRLVTVYVVAAGWHTSGDRDDVYQEMLRALERGIVDEGLEEDSGTSE